MDLKLIYSIISAISLLVFSVVILSLGMPWDESTAGSTVSWNEIVKEPLHETTRKTRKSLLLAATIGLIMGIGGVVPSEIAALGIKFAANEKLRLLQLTTAIIVFFHFSFLIYIRSDIYLAILAGQSAEIGAKTTILSRMIFEAGMPTIISIISVGVLVFHQI